MTERAVAWAVHAGDVPEPSAVWVEGEVHDDTPLAFILRDPDNDLFR